MGKHIYVYYRTLMGEFGHSIVVGEKHIPPAVAEACTESFTIDNHTYHYQPEHKEEALAYFESQGIKVPA